MTTPLTINPAAPAARGRQSVVVVGKENAGKSQLIAALTGRRAGEANFRGSTVSVEHYEADQVVYFDTPGILRRSDSATTRLALDALEAEDVVLLVVQAVQLDDDLADLLPLLQGKRGAVVVTYWDKVDAGDGALKAVSQLADEVGVPFIPVDARRLTLEQAAQIQVALGAAANIQKTSLRRRVGWRIEPRPGLLENQFFGPLAAVALLLLPALATIFGANRLADILHPIVAGWMQPLIDAVQARGPGWLKLVLTARQGDFGYGLLNMGPFLLVWTLPTVLLFSVILGVYKASGLVERINLALHPLVRPFGLSGRDVVRIMMGFGCNVPAVISTRACSGCSRTAAVSAIAFGAACSYQLPATLAVLGATGVATGHSPALLTAIFLAYLLVTTLIYLRLTSSREARNSLNVLMTPRRPFMQWPSPAAIGREAMGMLRQFAFQALPIFFLICLGASLLSHFGVLDRMSNVVAPLMRIFNLPDQAALPVVLASIRKDGIFLFANSHGLAFPMTAAQVLTGVYLAGVLAPCLVTVLTIARETSWKKAGSLLLRQAVFAVLFSLVLAWSLPWLL